MGHMCHFKHIINDKWGEKTVLRDKQKKTTSKYTFYIYLYKYKAFSSTGHFISLTLNFTFNIMKQLIYLFLY